MYIKKCLIIGGGPAGLMAAEQLTQAGCEVDLYDAMPSVGRKFLLAGLGGLNITHSEDYALFCQRYHPVQPKLQAVLDEFSPEQLRAWCDDLGVDTFVGTSGRVFPTAMKAAPLLRKWLSRLRANGLTIHPKHRWEGWDDQGRIILQSPQGEIRRVYDVLILALGGGSWKKLGSDGSWVAQLTSQGIDVEPLLPSNCGFHCDWSAHLQTHFAGAPVKSIAIRLTDRLGIEEKRMGEFIVTELGVEGSLIYAYSSRLRELLQQHAQATFYLDLLPNHEPQQLMKILREKPKSKSLSTYLKGRLKLDPVKRALLFEKSTASERNHTESLARALKNLPITLVSTTDIDQAISTAGGVSFSAVNQNLMLKQKTAVFCTGEMLDWDAPTGGYLLTACLALGKRAGLGALDYLKGA